VRKGGPSQPLPAIHCQGSARCLVGGMDASVSRSHVDVELFETISSAQGRSTGSGSHSQEMLLLSVWHFADLSQGDEELCNLLLDAIPVELESCPVSVVVRDAKVVDDDGRGLAGELAQQLLALHGPSVGGGGQGFWAGRGGEGREGWRGARSSSRGVDVDHGAAPQKRPRAKGHVQGHALPWPQPAG